MSASSTWMASLISFALMAQVYTLYKMHFSGADYHQSRANLFQKELAQEQLSHELTRYEFELFRQDVAAVIPAITRYKDLGERWYPQRNLASVVMKQNPEKLLQVSSARIFNEGRQYFKQRKYSEAAEKLSQFVQKYSFSIHIVEAHLLLAESHFQLRQLDRSIRVIDAMITHFPENEMTGFSLIRLGQIFETQERQQEAAGIYKTVMQAFKDPQVVAQARSALQNLQ